MKPKHSQLVAATISRLWRQARSYSSGAVDLAEAGACDIGGRRRVQNATLLGAALGKARHGAARRVAGMTGVAD